MFGWQYVVRLWKHVKDKWLIHKSVEAWKKKKYQYPELISISPESCPLCKHYHWKHRHRDTYKTSCIKCPIYQKTKTQFCRNTPYENVHTQLSRYIHTGENYTTLSLAIDSEIMFLKKL